MHQFPKRKNIRLKDYDYSKPGMYFITICTKNRECILSKINNKYCRGRVPPLPVETKIGKEIKNTIIYMNKNYNNIKIDTYVIMPNHIHLIIEITGRGGTLPLQDIIRNIKTYTTKKYNEINETIRLKLWQRNYYEHIIRNEKEYYKINKYIQTNPLKWKEDMFYK